MVAPSLARARRPIGVVIDNGLGLLTHWLSHPPSRSGVAASRRRPRRWRACACFSFLSLSPLLSVYSRVYIISSISLSVLFRTRATLPGSRAAALRALRGCALSIPAGLGGGRWRRGRTSSSGWSPKARSRPSQVIRRGYWNTCWTEAIFHASPRTNWRRWPVSDLRHGR